MSELTNELLAAVDGMVADARTAMARSGCSHAIVADFEKLLTIIEGLARELRAERAKYVPASTEIVGECEKIANEWRDCHGPDHMQDICNCAWRTKMFRELRERIKSSRPSPDKKGNTP